MRLFFVVTVVLNLGWAAADVSAAGIVSGKYAATGQTKTSLRVASCSVVPDKWDKAANWARIESLVIRAVEETGAAMVVTPEGALEGYVINEVNADRDTGRWEESVKKLIAVAEPLDGPYLVRARALADSLEIFLVLGFLERRGERLFNSVILIDPDGDIIGRYSKTHFAQGYEINPVCYTPGENYPVFQTPFGKVGMLICYDRQLPEPARILALKGAQVLLVPSYGSYDLDGWNTRLLQTRAYENGAYLVFCHPFQSLLIGRNGSLVSMAGPGEYTCYEINTSPDRYEGRFANRRPETYGELLEK